ADGRGAQRPARARRSAGRRSPDPRRQPRACAQDPADGADQRRRRACAGPRRNRPARDGGDAPARRPPPGPRARGRQARGRALADQRRRGGGGGRARGGEALSERPLRHLGRIRGGRGDGAAGSRRDSRQPDRECRQVRRWQRVRHGRPGPGRAAVRGVGRGRWAGYSRTRSDATLQSLRAPRHGQAGHRARARDRARRGRNLRRRDRARRERGSRGAARDPAPAARLTGAVRRRIRLSQAGGAMRTPMNDPAAPGSAPPRRSWGALALAIALFALGFAVANRFQLTHGVLHRAAANDWASAVETFGLLSLQALALLAAIALLGRWLFAVAMALAAFSIMVNLGYGQTVNDVLGTGTVAWMAAETRQVGNAAGEFGAPLLAAAAQTLAAIGSFVCARAAALRGGWRIEGATAGTAGLALLLAPTAIGTLVGVPASAAERNLYSLGLEVALAEPPPTRPP